MTIVSVGSTNGAASSADAGSTGRLTWTWQRISLALCVFGFLREIRPSEPFVTDSMVDPWRNVTVDEVNRYVYPIGTYSYAAQLVIVFLLTDFLRYKPLIIVSGLAGCVVWSLLLWTRSLANLQLGQCFYGTYMATEVAYYTYIYAKVDRRHYTTVTAQTRAAILMGRFAAGTTGQLLVFTESLDFMQLNYITLAAQAASTLWAFGLPAVQKSVYFHRTGDDPTAGDALKPVAGNRSRTSDDDTDERDASLTTADNGEPRRNGARPQRSFELLQFQLLRAYGNPDVLIWSVWTAFGMCGYLQTISYMQVLWSAIDKRPTAGVWNGAVEAVNTLLGAGCVLLASRMQEKQLATRRRKLAALTVLNVLQSGAVLVASQSGQRALSYVAYSAFYVLYSLTITLASAEVARHLEDDSYGLVFGINTLAALLLQSVLTWAIVADGGFALSVFGQFAVLSTYFGLLAVVCALAMLYDCLWTRSGRKKSIGERGALADENSNGLGA